MNSNLNFEFGPVLYRPKPEPGRTGTGQTELVPTGLVNPDGRSIIYRHCDELAAGLIRKLLKDDIVDPSSIKPFVVSATQKSWRGLGSKAAPWPAPRAITAATTSSNGLAMIVGLILMG